MSDSIEQHHPIASEPVADPVDVLEKKTDGLSLSETPELDQTQPTEGNQQQPVVGYRRIPETEEERAERLAKQEEVDGRSIYVGNVDYQSTPEQLEEFFHVVGVIERVTILFDRYSGLPKGYAYVEFENVESVERAIEELHGKEFRGREIRVTAKRTNLPGFKKRGGFRGRSGYRGTRGNPRGSRGGFRGNRGSFRGRGGIRGGRGGFRDGEGEVDGYSASLTDGLVDGSAAAAAAAAEE